MNLLAKAGKAITGIDVKGIFSVVTNTLDEVITNKEELAEAKLKLKEQEARAELEQEKARTNRHAADMNSDSWLSKNIRPLTLGVLLLFYFVLAIADSIGWNFEVKTAYISLLETLMVSAFGFYFVMREVGKGITTVKVGENKKEGNQIKSENARLREQNQQLQNRIKELQALIVEIKDRGKKEAQ